MKRFMTIFLAGVMLMCSSGCSNIADIETDPGTVTVSEAEILPLAAVSLPQAAGFDDYDARRAVRDENAVDEGFIAALSAFAAKSGAALPLEAGENLCYSPMSLYFALAMAAQGAEGETESELLSLLGAGDPDALAEQCAMLYRRMYTDNEVGKLLSANSVWVDDDFAVREEFAKKLAEYFYAGSFNADLAGEASAIAMSQWVKEHTGGKLAPEFKPDPLKAMSLINTIYLKDEWSFLFPEENTAPATFHAENGDIECDFMNSTFMGGSVLDGENFIATKLYTKNNCTMAFILPDEGVEAASLLGQAAEIAAGLNGENAAYGELIFSVPKFRFSSELSLAKMLIGLGLDSAFDAERANFSGISEQPSFISSVVQGTYIAIDEKGVEAAAYTELALCGAGMPAESFEITLERPFLFVITSPYDSAPLFIGLVNDPMAE